MKCILNKLPVKTTNNFKVNDLKIDLELPEQLNFLDYNINNSKYIDICNKEEKITSKIGLEFNKYKEVNITIPKNTQVIDTIIIRYDFSKSNNLIDKINIKLLENSSVNIIIIYTSSDDLSSFHYLVENLECKNNSYGNISIINLMNSKSKSFVAIETFNSESSDITHNIIDLGGNVKVSNMYSKLTEYAPFNKLNSIYLGNDSDIIDMNYYLKNIGPKSSNIMRVEGCLMDHAKKTFRGIIDFVKGCKKAIGDESENCILMSDKAVARSLPELLCGEDDVIGSHGVASGKIANNKLFYLMSRGYTEKAAKRLIVLSRFMSIINQIPDLDIQEEIKEFLDTKFND